MLQNAALYEQDFYAWTETTAALLRKGKWQEVDLAALAEEVESLGKRDRRELGSRLQTLVMHLLKWAYQSSERSGSWRGTIRRERQEIAALLSDSPSLRQHVRLLLSTRYAEARLDASDETGLPLRTFPETCPWTIAQVQAADFWPDETRA